MTGPLEAFLQGDGHLVLDGGLATELECAGCDLAHPLWSARLIRTRPEDRGRASGLPGRRGRLHHDGHAAAVTDKPLVAYPNSGEAYDGTARAWRGPSDPRDWGERACAWRAAGARVVGGCCRTGPDHVRAVRAALEGDGGPHGR